MKATLRLAWIDALRTILSWRWVAAFAAILPTIYLALDTPTYFTPDDVEVEATVHIGDAIPQLFAANQRILVLFVLPIVLIAASMVGDDRAQGGPMATVPRVGGPARWWAAKVLATALVCAAYVATYVATALTLAILRGYDLDLSPSELAGVEPGQRTMDLLPGHGAVGTTAILPFLLWWGLVSVVLLGAAAGVVARNRVTAYLVPVGLIVLTLFNGSNVAWAKLLNPAAQLDIGAHNPETGAVGYSWATSIAVTSAWIGAACFIGWIASRRVEL